jgi:hypothetical protein
MVFETPDGDRLAASFRALESLAGRWRPSQQLYEVDHAQLDIEQKSKDSVSEIQKG